MTDPFRMIPVMESPGRDRGIRDRAGTIDFIAPGRGDAATRRPSFTSRTRCLTRSAAPRGRPEVSRRFETGITAPDGSMIARVRKPLPVRQKRGQPPRD